MSESSGVRGRNIMIAVTAAAVVIVAAVAVGVGLSGDSDDDGTVAVPPSGSQTDDDAGGGTSGGDGRQLATGQGAKVLPKAMGGQEAIDELGDKLSVVAERNNMTEDKLRDLLLRDASLKVTPTGSLLYVDNMTPPPSQ